MFLFFMMNEGHFKMQYASKKPELIRAGRYFHTAMADQNKKNEKNRFFKICSINATLFSVVS